MWVVTIPFAANDRAWADGDLRGFSQLVTTKAGRILGVTLAGAHAGEQIQTWALTLSGKLKLSQVAGMIAPYPTRSEMDKRLAGEWYAPMRFSPTTRMLAALLKRLA